MSLRKSVIGVAGCAIALGACVQGTPSARAAAADSTKAAYPKMAAIDAYLMDRDAEIALARTAAPDAISKDATVMVLTKKGYETAVTGKNGFVCMVERSWYSSFDDPEFWNPKERGPACLNAPAVRSALPVSLKRTELALAGLGKDEIVARLKGLVAAHSFSAPEIGSMAYMLSKVQYLNDQGVHWHPHLMIYVPGDMDASVWGANLPDHSPVYGGGAELPGGGRLPWTLFVVPVPRWSDGSPFEAPMQHP